MRFCARILCTCRGGKTFIQNTGFTVCARIDASHNYNGRAYNDEFFPSYGGDLDDWHSAKARFQARTFESRLPERNKGQMYRLGGEECTL